MESRISRESSRLLSSLNPDSRYILFSEYKGMYIAQICSQITDESLAVVLTGEGYWTFTDKEKAIRSIRRLNKDIQIYTGQFEISFTD